MNGVHDSQHSPTPYRLLTISLCNQCFIEDKDGSDDPFAMVHCNRMNPYQRSVMTVGQDDLEWFTELYHDPVHETGA